MNNIGLEGADHALVQANLSRLEASGKPDTVQIPATPEIAAIAPPRLHYPASDPDLILKPSAPTAFRKYPSDYTGYKDTVAEDLPGRRVLIADKGHDSQAIRADVRDHRGTAVIPARRTARRSCRSTASSTPCAIGSNAASTG